MIHALFFSHNFAKKKLLRESICIFCFISQRNFLKKEMPSKCLICASWFVTDARCCEECDEPEDFKNLCGNCSGVGPYNQRYVSAPHSSMVQSIESANYDRMQKRKQEAEEQRRKMAKLMENYRV
jgi:hypothetical protein